MQQDLLTVAEAAGRMRLHPDTVRRFTDDGRLPYVRYTTGPGSARRLIPARAVEDFIASHTVIAGHQ